MQYLNARYYDPRLGMFLQPDWFEVTAAGVGTNRYATAGGDPVNASDPGGEMRGLGPPYMEILPAFARSTDTTVSPYFRTSTGANPGGAGCGVASSHTTTASGAIQPPDRADCKASSPNPLA